MTETQSTAPGTSIARAAERRPGRSIPELGALVVFLVGEIIFFSLKSPYFWHPFKAGGWDNWLNILTNISVIGIMAGPATLLLIAGQFDLSVGSGAGFCGVLMAYTATNLGWDHAWAVLIVILAGIGIGFVNGFFVTVVGVNALITTLGMLAVLRGLQLVIAHGQTLLLTGFSGIGTARPFFNIPVPVLIVVVVIAIFWFIMRYTVYGRSMYAIGSNPVAARLTGIRSKRLIFAGFVLSGICVALGGLILVSQLGAASPTSGTGYELQVITAVVLGGASLAGGRVTILGTALGLLIVGVLNNGLILLNIDAYWQQVAQGTLLIAAVSFDQLRVRLTAQ